jgi:hypothetical protein
MIQVNLIFKFFFLKKIQDGFVLVKKCDFHVIFKATPIKNQFILKSFD